MSGALLPGGFLGVDVFFVISGYLITGILLRENEAGSYSLGRFYARRARRIFPALILVLATALVAGWFLFDRYSYAELGKHSALGAAFVPNIGYWLEASYFEPGAFRRPLLHLWSLGVEEQFYLAWPLVIALFGRRRWRVATALTVIALLSFGYCLFLTWTDPTAAFYSPLSRCWELAVGGIVAVAAQRGRAIPAPQLAGLAGFLLIAAGYLLVSADGLVPGAWALLPVTGAALVIWSGPSTWAGRLLASPPLVGVGLISYPLYLWHWPLLAFASYANDFAPLSSRQVVPLMAGALALSAATYWWVEKPLKRRSPWLLLAGLAAVGTAGAAIAAAHGWPQRAANQAHGRWLTAAYRELHERGLASAYRAECDFQEWHRFAVKAAIDPACTRPGARGTVLLWGDSHAQALSLGLREQLPRGVALAQVATSGCTPALPAERPWYRATNPAIRACERSNRAALAAVERLKPELVILTQARFHEQTNYAALAARIRAAGAGRVAVVGPVPQWTRSLPEMAAADWPKVPRVNAVDLDPSVARTDAAMLARPITGFRYIPVAPALCDRRGCRTMAGRQLLLVDEGHLSPDGSRLVASIVLKALESGR